MNDRKLRFGVFGAGRIGKIHAGNLAGRIPRAEVAALCDVFPGELAAVAAKLGVAATFSDYRRVLEMPDIDAVAVCTSTDTHYQIVLDACAAGKHVFCEKPLDLSIERIQAIDAAVAKAGVKVMVAFNRRFDPNFLKVRETVAAGGIGTPQIVKITSRDPAPPPEAYVRASGGIFLDMSIHDFDMARYLAGSDVTEVYARAGVMTDPMFERAGDWDTAVVSLTFASGAFGVIDNSRKAVYGYDQRVEVFGSEGMIAVANNTPDTHVLLDHTGAHSALPLNFFMTRYTESYLREMEAFVDAIAQDRPAPVTVRDSLAAVVVGLAAGKSVKENRPVKTAEILPQRTAAA